MAVLGDGGGERGDGGWVCGGSKVGKRSDEG